MRTTKRTIIELDHNDEIEIKGPTGQRFTVRISEATAAGYKGGELILDDIPEVDMFLTTDGMELPVMRVAGIEPDHELVHAPVKGATIFFTG